MIDRQTGYLHFSEIVSIGPATREDTLISLFRLHLDERHDHQNGFTTIILKNIPLDRLYFNFKLSCYQGYLCTVQFVMGRLPFNPSSDWDDLSEQEEHLRPENYKQWLSEEPGQYNTFGWGTVAADHTPGVVTGTIGIQYVHEAGSKSR